MTPTSCAPALYAFDLVQKRAKRPAGAPDKALARPVTKVGIVGAGLMASQLALLFARRLEVPVVLTDLDQERVDKGVGYVHAEIDKLLGKGRISPDKANRLQGPGHRRDRQGRVFADADFVIEAVFEEMTVKKQVFAEVEKVVSPECVLATNTSSLSVTEMAADLEHPERVVGFHFFNPVAVMPLLEIVRASATDDATLATAFATGKALKKSCVLVKDARRSSSTGCSAGFMGEVGRVVDEGTPLRGRRRRVRRLGCRCRRSSCCPWSARRSRCTTTRPCTRRSRTGSTSPPNLERVVGGARSRRLRAPDGAVDPEVEALLREARRAGRARTRPRCATRVLAGAGRGGPADARRGRRRRARGPRPGDDHRRRLPVLERRPHPAPGPRRPSERVTGTRFLPAGSPACRPDTDGAGAPPDVGHGGAPAYGGPAPSRVGLVLSHM